MYILWVFHLICGKQAGEAGGSGRVLLKSTGWPTHRCCSANPHLLNPTARPLRLPPVPLLSQETQRLFSGSQSAEELGLGGMEGGKEGGRVGWRERVGGNCSPARPPKSLHDFLIGGPGLRVRRLQSGPHHSTPARWGRWYETPPPTSIPGPCPLGTPGPVRAVRHGGGGWVASEGERAESGSGVGSGKEQFVVLKEAGRQSFQREGGGCGAAGGCVCVRVKGKRGGGLVGGVGGSPALK